jgi:hypothetical protein
MVTQDMPPAKAFGPHLPDPDPVDFAKVSPEPRKIDENLMQLGNVH